MTSRSYVALVKENKDFRKLWLAAVLSMLGEWFNTIALFFLILEYTGSEFLLGLLFTVRMFGFAIFQPIIGLFADRYSRKFLMISSNLVQTVLALCFLFVNDAGDIPWMIGLSGVMMMLHGVYMTAERAALPNLVEDEDLATANALDAASWSTALCIGAMLGGLVVSSYGTNAAFIVDSATFLIGTLFLLPLKIPQEIEESMRLPLFSSALTNIKSGWKRITSQPSLFRIVFAKAAWNIAGGGLAGVFLVLLGANVTGYGAAFGFGLFFFARGIGTGLGPLVARNLFSNEEKWPSLIGQLVVLSGIFYLLVGATLSINLWLTVVFVILAHCASGANWVLSTIMMQAWVEDEVRGRVFSTDIIILSLAFSISTTCAGYLMEQTNLSIANGIMIFASVMVCSGVVFTLWQPEIDHQSSPIAG